MAHPPLAQAQVLRRRLGAKHTYLLRQMKSLGLEDSPGP